MLKRKFNIASPILVFMVMYLIWFEIIEQRPIEECFEIHAHIDQLIPFCEYFIVPYFLWFLFFPAILIYQLFNDEQEYKRLQGLLMAGMLVFLVINTMIPTAIRIRPTFLVQKNVFTRLVGLLYAIDTPTNVFPSIHVYNTIAACVSFFRSHGEFAQKRSARVCVFAMSVGIVLSTVLLKQHSVIDVTMAFVMYWAFILLEPSWVARKAKYELALRHN